MSLVSGALRSRGLVNNRPPRFFFMTEIPKGDCDTTHGGQDVGQRGFFPAEPTPLSMLDGLRAGEDTAWEHFVKIFGSMIYGMLRHKGLSEDDACEIGQEVLIKVQSQLGKFVHNGTDYRLRYWLPSVIHSVFVDATRKQQKRFVPIGGSDFHTLLEQSPDEWWSKVAETDFEFTDDDDRIAIQATLEMLQPKFSENSWRCFYATQILGRPSREIAEELDLKDGAVRQAALRIKNRLARELAGFVEIENSKSEA